MHSIPRAGIRRLAVVAAAAATVAIVASGCSATTTPADAPDASDYTKYESILTDEHTGESVDFWGWDTLEFNKPIEDYVRAVAGVDTKGRQIPNEDLLTQLKLAVQGGGMPDIFKSGTSNIPTLVQIGAVRDITDLVEPYRDYLPDIGWEQVTYDGKIYGIPVNSPAGGMFYRADVLAEYGIDPASLDTWDKYVAAAKQLSEASNGEVHLFGFEQSIAVGVQMTFIQQQHVWLHDADGNVTISGDDPGWLKVMETMRKVLEPGVGKEVPEWSPEWFQAMKDGSLASFPSGTWFVQTLIQQAPDTKGAWTFTPYPAAEEGGDRYVDFGSAIIAISSKTDKAEAAFELAKAWSIDPEGAVGLGLEELGISVVSTAALDSDYVTEPHEYFANDQAYWKDATDAYSNISWSPPVTDVNQQALGVFSTDLSEWIEGGLSDEEFLDKVADDLKTQVKGLK